MFRLEISTDNAAFTDDPAAEIARILRNTANRIEDYGVGTAVADSVRDTNGNTVGEYRYAAPADEDAAPDLDDVETLEDALAVLGIGGTVEYGDRRHTEHDRAPRESSPWSWQLEPTGPWHMREPLSGAYWTGSATTDEPAVVDVVWSLLMDASYLEDGDSLNGLALADIDAIRGRAAWLREAAQSEEAYERLQELAIEL